MLTEPQRAALAALDKGTRGTCDPWDLMGPAYVPLRVEIFSALMGKQMPRKSSGVCAIVDALRTLAAKEATGRADESLYQWAHRMAGAAQ